MWQLKKTSRCWIGDVHPAEGLTTFATWDSLALRIREKFGWGRLSDSMIPVSNRFALGDAWAADDWIGIGDWGKCPSPDVSEKRPPPQTRVTGIIQPALKADAIPTRKFLAMR